MFVSGDTILEQVEFTYDDGGNVIETVTRRRYHNAPASQTGELKNPSETAKARVTYLASYPDALGRTQAAVNYGTNGGSALSRSSTIPTGSDDVLVTQTSYDAAGNTAAVVEFLRNSMGVREGGDVSNGLTRGFRLPPALGQVSEKPGYSFVTQFTYDDRGRETSRVMNPQTSSSSSSSGGGCDPSADENVTVETAYNADGNVSSITAKNASTGDQVTQYVYSTTLSDSAIASSLLKRKEIYPDSTGDSDSVRVQPSKPGHAADRPGRHGARVRQTRPAASGGFIEDVAMYIDALKPFHLATGKQTGLAGQDRVTALEAGVDGAVRRISTEYEVRGMREKITSWNNASVTAGDIVNQVQFTYNDFGQLTTDYQSHSGAVNTSTTPKVQYGYANGSANTIRPTTLTYPDGRVLTYDYGSTDSMADALSRIASLVDDDVSSTHLVDSSYLGLSTFVETDYTEPDIEYTLVGTAGGNDPDTGDIYRGLDRFGRIKDSDWYDYGSAVDVDRIKYGYDRAGNRLWRENEVARSLSKEFDELYDYDAVHRLKDMSRGTLNGGRTALTSTTFAQCWGLDKTGNWKNFRADDDGDGSWDLNQNRTANKVNEITDVTEPTGASWVTPAYSAAGNMTTVPKPADPTASFTATYDAWNRLTMLVDTTSSNTVAEYEYDAAKRRVTQKSYTGGTLDETRHLFYTEPSKWQVIEERVDSSADPNRQFVWGLRYIDDLVLRDRDTTGNGTLDERRYALQDANWNVTSTTDASGTVQQRMAYQAYGTTEFLTAAFAAGSNSDDWETLYAGYRWESATAIYHVRHRVLNAALGTWAQRDPRPPRHVGLYEYVSSRPLEKIDPLGLYDAVSGPLPDLTTSECAIGFHCWRLRRPRRMIEACGCAPGVFGSHCGITLYENGTKRWLDGGPRNGNVHIGEGDPNYEPYGVPWYPAYEIMDVREYPRSVCECLRTYQGTFNSAALPYNPLCTNCNFALRCMTSACGVAIPTEMGSMTLHGSDCRMERAPSYGCLRWERTRIAGRLEVYCAEYGLISVPDGCPAEPPASPVLP